MGLRDTIKDISALSGIVAETRRATKFVSDFFMSKKDIDALKAECRREQKRRQDLEIAIKAHRKEMEESAYPRRFECDLNLWKQIESSFEPNGKVSDFDFKK